MFGKITPYTKLLPSYLAALIVLLSLGFVNTGNTSPAKTTDSLIQPESLKNYSTSTPFFTQKKSTSSLPEELPVTIQEQEEYPDDDKNDDVITPGCNHKGQKYIPQRSTSIHLHNFTDSPQPSSIPLYILFHSWKGFIC